jgi:hypothetical protein
MAHGHRVANLTIAQPDDPARVRIAVMTGPGPEVSLGKEIRLCRAALLYGDAVTLYSPNALMLASVEQLGTATGDERIELLRALLPIIEPEAGPALNETLDQLMRLRRARRRSQGRGKTFISPELMISERPAEAADRAVPGHWEGDLILGLGSSAIGTLVERTTRFNMLLHLPRMTGHGQPRIKNGSALAGHGAEAVRDAIAASITTLPDQLRRSLTWDQGAEMAQHAQLHIDIGLAIYFCDPHSPWQ